MKSCYNKHYRVILSTRQKGLTLIELGIAVAIAITIAVVALLAVPDLIATTKADAESKNIPKIAANLQTLYSSSPQFPTTAGQVAKDGIKFNAFPSEMVVNAANGTLQNRWGGVVTVTATASQATLQEVDIPNRECAKIAAALATSFRDLQVGPETTIGTPAGTLTSMKVAATGQFNPAAMGTPGTSGPCTSTVDANTLSFIFSK